MVLDIKAIIEVIADTARTCRIDPNLAVAIASVESAFDPLAVRFEPAWDYLISPSVYAASLNISQLTEETLQKMSWGCMQVMGSVARELGYDENLVNLTRPELGARYGCMKLKSLSVKYSQEENLISAYNAGTPGKANGVYRNQRYVTTVSDALARLRRLN